MKIPREFDKVLSSLYIGSMEKCSTPEEWAALAAEANQKHEIIIATQFLETLLGSNPSIETLRKVWNGAASYFLLDEDLLRFLPILLKALKASPRLRDS